MEGAVNVWSEALAFKEGTFRFFNVENDWQSGLNYPYFVEQGYAIDARLEDAADGDNNFRFTGSPETYAITANGVDKTIALN